jgi:hypothetical protein
MGSNSTGGLESLKDRFCSAPVLTFLNFEESFILTTDASKIAKAAILSQVQNVVERPIAYTSRQINTAERTYTASEADK